MLPGEGPTPSAEIFDQVQQDAFRFDQTLVGTIPDLTPDLESSFHEGGSVIGPEDGLDMGATTYLLMRQGSGAGTNISERASAKSYQAYRQWKARAGFPDWGGSNYNHRKTSVSPQGPLRDLKHWAKSKGIKIQGETGDQQAAYLHALLAFLPDSLLSATSPDGRRYFDKVRLNSHRVGAAMLSAFDRGALALYSGILNGSRRQLLGITLHEIGHSTAYRYALEAEPNSNHHWDIPPDSSIPMAVRVKMHQAVQTVAKSGQMFALDWAGGVAYRRSYCKDFGEFIAETHLHYIAQGERFRSHIAGIADPKVREAYRWIYEELRQRVFGGEQYL